MDLYEWRMNAFEVPMKTVWMLLLVLAPLTVDAVEFTHIKLKPHFQEYIRRLEMKRSQVSSSRGKTMMMSSDDASAPDDQAVRSILVGSGEASKSFSTRSSTPGTNESLLYDEIRRQLELSHQGIGQAQVGQIQTWNNTFNLGSQNYSGFSWQKPFGTASVNADRQITPPMTNDQWMILDSFTINIQATTFLEKLKEAGLVDPGMDIAAFAGINFHRTYYYWHFANSYNEALASDYSKLFLPFMKFNKEGIETMGDGEIIRREDKWTAKAGGLITSPPLYNFSISGGILAQYDLKQMVSVQSSKAEDANSPRFRLGVTSSKSAMAGATTSVQLDFFNLLKVTLLEYDLSYTYTAGKSYALSLSQQQWQHVSQDPTENAEFKNIMTGFGEVKALEPYVTLLDENKVEDLKQQGSVLLWGKLKKQKTESIHTIKDGVATVWFKNYSQSVRFVQNLWSRIFSTVLYAILKLPVGTKDAAIYSKEIEMEFKATHPQAAVNNIQRIESSEQFSFKLTQSYEASSTTRWTDKRYKNDVVWFIDEFTTLPKNLLDAVRSENLRGPMIVESKLLIEKAGFDYFVNRPISETFIQIANVCASKKVADWADENKRNALLKANLTGNEKCVKDIGLLGIAFLADYRANYLKPSLYKFKQFIAPYYKRSENLSSLIGLFGAENTFVNGKIFAATNIGSTFTQHFSNGQFRGLGVIDNYYRSTGSRMPASIGE